MYRGSQSAYVTVVVENLTVKLYSWDEEMGQCPMNVSEFKVHMRSLNFCYTITSTDLCSVHTIFEVPDIFSEVTGMKFYILILSTLAGLPHFFICTFQRVLKLQLGL